MYKYIGYNHMMNVHCHDKMVSLSQATLIKFADEIVKVEKKIKLLNLCFFKLLKKAINLFENYL